MNILETYNYVNTIFKDDKDKGGHPYIGHLDVLYVKKANLEDNMNLGRLSVITEKDIKRLETRYIPSWKKVVKRIKELELYKTVYEISE